MVPIFRKLIGPVCVHYRKGVLSAEQDFGTRTGAGRTLHRPPIASGLLTALVSTHCLFNLILLFVMLTEMPLVANFQ